MRAGILATAALLLALAKAPSFARASEGAALGDTAGFLDTLDDALSFSADNGAFRARISGTLDAEAYHFQQPAPGLILSHGNDLLNPRLSLFLDAQLGARVYVFAESRVDRGFDPAARDARVRMDEYALRFTPSDDTRLSFQVGKFATIVGGWIQRHDSWDNPFVTAPLPYENLTGIWDVEAARSGGILLLWANAGPRPSADFPNKGRSVPIIWGPSYASGASVSGAVGKLTYAAEAKNAALSSRPEAWNAYGGLWDRPTVSARVGYVPDARWNFGLSTSTGPYLRPEAAGTYAPAQGPGDYREILFGQDASFTWHHLQLWAEAFETRFTIPIVGHADTFAYYLEGKYKFTPRFFGALRWNQQLFSTVPLPGGRSARWGSDVWRVDAGPGFRFTPRTQLKVQYSFEREDNALRDREDLLAAQFTVRF